MIRFSQPFDQRGLKRHRDDMDCGATPIPQMGGAGQHPEAMMIEFRQMLDKQKSQNNEFATMLQEFKNVLNEIKQEKRSKIETPDFDYYS